MTKCDKYEREGLWSRIWMGWTMVDEMIEMDYDRWNEWDWLW